MSPRGWRLDDRRRLRARTSTGLSRLHPEAWTPPAALTTVAAVRSVIEMPLALGGGVAAFGRFVPLRRGALVGSRLGGRRRALAGLGVRNVPPATSTALGRGREGTREASARARRQRSAEIAAIAIRGTDCSSEGCSDDCRDLYPQAHPHRAGGVRAPHHRRAYFAAGMRTPLSSPRRRALQQELNRIDQAVDQLEGGLPVTMPAHERLKPVDKDNADDDAPSRALGSVAAANELSRYPSRSTPTAMAPRPCQGSKVLRRS
jgi:hypothetical protein